MKSPMSKGVVLMAQTYIRFIGTGFEPDKFAKCWVLFVQDQFSQLLKQAITGPELFDPKQKEKVQAVLDLLEADSQAEAEWQKVRTGIYAYERIDAEGLGRQVVKAKEILQRKELIQQMYVRQLRAGLLEAAIHVASARPLIIASLATYADCQVREAEAGKVAQQAGGDAAITAQITNAARQTTIRAVEDTKRLVIESLALIMDGIVYARVRHSRIKYGVGDEQNEAFLEAQCVHSLFGKFNNAVKAAMRKAPR